MQSASLGSRISCDCEESTGKSMRPVSESSSDSDSSSEIESELELELESELEPGPGFEPVSGLG
jgi:hypothetical protein